MDISLAAARSAAPCMGAATVRGPPGKRRDVDLFIEVLNLRLTLDAIEVKNHVNGHIKLLLSYLNEMPPTTLTEPRFSGGSTRGGRAGVSALALRQRRHQAHA